MLTCWYGSGLLVPLSYILRQADMRMTYLFCPQSRQARQTASSVVLFQLPQPPPPHTHTKCLCFPPCLPITTHICQKYLWWCAVKPNKNWRTLRKSQEDEGHHELKFYFVVLLTVFWLFCRGTSGFIGRQTQFRPISNITWSLDARESVLGHSGGSLSGHPDRRQESDVLLRNHYSIHRCLLYRI